MHLIGHFREGDITTNNSTLFDHKLRSDLAAMHSTFFCSKTRVRQLASGLIISSASNHRFIFLLHFLPLRKPNPLLPASISTINKIYSHKLWSTFTFFFVFFSEKQAGEEKIK